MKNSGEVDRGPFSVGAPTEDQKAPTTAGNADDPTSRKHKEKAMTTADVVSEGLSAEDEAIKKEEDAEVGPDYSDSDSARLDISEWQDTEEKRRADLRSAEQQAGWSPRKGVAVREAPDELHTEAVKQIAAEKARFLREKGQLKMPRGGGERPAQKPVGKPQADKRRAA